MGQVETLVHCGEDCLRGESTSSANSKVVLTNMKVINNEKSEGIRQHPLATTDTPEKPEPPEASTPLELQGTPQIPNDTPGQTEHFATCSGIPAIAMKCQMPRLAKCEPEDSAVALPQGAKSPSTRQGSEKNFVLHSRDSSCDSGVLSASSSPAADHIKMLMAKDPVEGCQCVSDGRKRSTGHLGALQMSVFSLDEDADCQAQEHPEQSFLGGSQGESLQDKPTEEEVKPSCFSTSPAEEKSLGDDYRNNGWEELPLQEHPLRKYPTSDSLDEYMDTCCRLSQVNEGNAKTYSSGLDYLEHICQLIEKMGQLQEQNLKLQKEICSLQKEQKAKQEYFLKHCSCGAASFLLSNDQEAKNSFPGWSSRPHSLLALNGNVSDLSVIPEIGGNNEKSTKKKHNPYPTPLEKVLY